jgi:hypothetical protein
MNEEFNKAFSFLYDETYPMWKSDMQKIFRIGTRGTKGVCNLSSCILVFIGIESFSKFFSKKKNDADAFDDFVNQYYPAEYKGKMKKVYELFRHGLAHNYFPKSEFNLKNTSTIAFGVDEQKRVVSLTRLKRSIEDIRRKVLKLDPKPGRPYIIVPQVLFLDTVAVMEALKKKMKNDNELQAIMIKNHKRIRKILRHPV